MATDSSRDAGQESSLTERKLLLGSTVLVAILVLTRTAPLAAGSDVHSLIGSVAYGAILLWVTWFLVWAFLGGRSRLAN